jgi:hypothetical protein
MELLIHKQKFRSWITKLSDLLLNLFNVVFELLARSELVRFERKYRWNRGYIYMGVSGD